jgi:hypothetical protein
VKSKSIRKEKWWFIVIQIPLYVCGYLFNPLYVILRAMSLRPLGRYLDRKDAQKLTSDIRHSLSFSIRSDSIPPIRSVDQRSVLKTADLHPL